VELKKYAVKYMEQTGSFEYTRNILKVRTALPPHTHAAVTRHKQPSTPSPSLSSFANLAVVHSLSSRASPIFRVCMKTSSRRSTGWAATIFS
jgi:hypothetical protein